MSQTEDKHVHHSMDYIEFTVTDLPLAKQFFSKAFGWEFTDYAPVYAGIKGPDREVGGLTVGEVQPGGPLVVLYSGDLEDTLEKVESAGGRIVAVATEMPEYTAETRTKAKLAQVASSHRQYRLTTPDTNSAAARMRFITTPAEMTTMRRQTGRFW